MAATEKPSEKPYVYQDTTLYRDLQAMLESEFNIVKPCRECGEV